MSGKNKPDPTDIRGDINVMAGGVTWVSADYDERTGEVLRPLTQDKSRLDPDWSLWRAVPKLELWEAVALSLGFSPLTWDSALEHRRVPEEVAMESQKRLRIARAHLGDGLAPCMPAGSPERTEVRLKEFCSWAQGMGWDMPAEMAATAAANSALPAAPARSSARHSTVTRADLLDPLIDDAIEAAGSCETARVWPEMVLFARERRHPLIGVEGNELRHEDGSAKDGVGFFTRKNLSDRLRRREKRGSAR